MDRFGLQFDGYCLCSGTIEPRKNIGRLLDAYESLPIAIRSRWPLVLCGFAGWKSELLHERIADLERQGSIRYLGYISDTDLPLLYAGARAFIYPSLYEGFGLPVLEAMAAGVPIVYSDAASIPEVAGNAGIMVNPQDTRALANSIAEILENESSRTKLIQAGLQRASRFSWEHCAANTAQIYQQTAQS